INIFTHGKPVPPHFSSSFPAKRVTTELTWEDLVINNELKSQIDELMNWVNFNAKLMNRWDMEKRLRKGYRALFYGPPGTGKTFTAGLLGKYTGKEVYKIDLSMIVSKYIGETEKNLELLFSRAEDKGWILFFDEADALFGKRTNVRDAHDKYANQEVSYLLQRIEDYNGLIILATNMKNNIDDAFIRRFNAILKFSFPDANERAMIWRRTFPAKSTFVGGDIPEMIKRYELAGGSILNVVHYACLKAIEKHTDDKEELEIYINDVLDGIKREFVKEGKPF
ncbi:ATP-binding protein, partial [Chitinophaga sp.]|uniref:ATP-binding protein n=1 Tax=Chitinophaga sp. TaxID=1869181 RepID=UPI0031E43C86